jgi:hypothetical protein
MRRSRASSSTGDLVLVRMKFKGGRRVVADVLDAEIVYDKTT